MTSQSFDPRGQDQIPVLRGSRYSQSVEWGLAVLECFTPKCPVLGIAEIADRLGMSRSTVHRYVITLAALGFLDQGARRKYRLSVSVTRLGMSALNSTDLCEHARPYLEALCWRTSYTVSLAVLDGPELLCVDCARSFRRRQYMVGLNLRPGSRLPVYCTSMGKVLLANLPESERREVIGGMTLAPRGPNSITSKKALHAELEHVLVEGMAVNDEELRVGVISIAAPVRDESRDVVAAVDVVAHSSMISVEEMASQLQAYLLATVDEISARLGYRRDDEATR